MLPGRSEPDVVRIRRDTGGLLVAAGPLLIPCWCHCRQAKTGYKYLAAPVPQIQEQIVDKAVDVPVTMQYKFQQSVPFDRGSASSHATETGTHSAKLRRRTS